MESDIIACIRFAFFVIGYLAHGKNHEEEEEEEETEERWIPKVDLLKPFFISN